VAEWAKKSLFSASNSHFSLFFPELQGNRTDGERRRDGACKASLKWAETLVN
jgi:hypothetical protein